MSWSLYDAHALNRRLVLLGIPRNLARRAAFMDGPATLARMEKIQLMDFDEIVSASLSGAHRNWPLKEETGETVPGWLAAAQAEAKPASGNEAKTLLAAAMVDIPPWPGFDRVAAMPVYLRHLDDLPRAVLENALADCRNICPAWPSIAEIRLAAEPYLGQVMRRLWRLQELAKDGPQ